MRRSDREIVDRAEMDDILTRGKICHLGLIFDGRPYVVPMCYGYEDGYLYFHSAMDGRKVEIIRRGGEACFQVECDVEVRDAAEACGWTMGYASVIGYGNIEFMNEPARKLEALDVLMRQYSGRKGWEVPPGQLESTLVFRLKITEMTGKRS